MSLKRIIRFTLRTYTDHTLPSDSTMTVDAYDRNLDTYFARDDNYIVSQKNAQTLKRYSSKL